MKNTKSKLVLKPYNKFEVCPECSETKDLIYIEVLGVYDGSLYIRCKHCNTCFHRFPKDHYLHDKAQQYADGEIKGYE